MKPYFHEELSKSLEEKKNHLQCGEVIKMPYKRFDKSIPALFKEDGGNAGFDLFARLDSDIVLEPGDVAVVPLNVATKIPAFAVGLLFQRSSTFRKWGVRLTNGVGVMDSTFSGDEDEYGAEFQNVTDEPITIKHGDKVCQAVFLPLLPVIPTEYDTFSGPNRGGFGTSFDNAGDLKR